MPTNLSYKLKLRCSLCNKVEESEQTLQELQDVESDEICPGEFWCKECSDDYYPIVLALSDAD